MRERFELPNEQCERLTRPEMNAVRMMLILASSMAYAKEDLCKRVKSVPDGTERMDKLLDDCSALFEDILGTVSDKQRKQLRNSAKDYEIRLVPKSTPWRTTIAVQKDDVIAITDCARERCKYCTLDGKDAQECHLYKLLEAYIPLDDYGDDIICPYAYAEWRDNP